jgi:hypothetical protein
MPFESMQPGVIRAVTQRGLFNAWARLRAAKAGLPHLDDFHPERMHDEIRETGFYSVLEHEGRRRFRIDSDGVFLATAFGRSGRGKFIDEYIAPELIPILLPSYERCADLAMAVYTVASLTDRDGHEVFYERLLLPFGERNAVSRIVTSLKAVAPDGHFEVADILSGKHGLPQMRLRALIDPALAPAKVIVNDDVTFA